MRACTMTARETIAAPQKLALRYHHLSDITNASAMAMPMVLVATVAVVFERACAKEQGQRTTSAAAAAMRMVT